MDNRPHQARNRTTKDKHRPKQQRTFQWTTHQRGTR
jgi:hypothetical protein